MKHWTVQLTNEATEIVKFAQDYARNHAGVALPGRNMILTIDALVGILEEYDRAFASYIRTPVVQRVSWSQDPSNPGKGCWRDIDTGVIVPLDEEDRKRYTSEH